MNILTLSICYLPGYKAGGPIKSIAGLVERLGDELKFKIVTMDRDWGDDSAYPSIARDCWNPVGKAEVFYLAPGQVNLPFLYRLIKNTPHDVLYLNSIFAPDFTIRPLLLRKVRLIPRVPTIVAPRGELSQSALTIKFRKKRLYLAFARILGLYRNVIWQVSSEHERDDLSRNLADIVRVHDKMHRVFVTAVVAPDLVARTMSSPARERTAHKVPGALRAVFLSRVSRMKNLDGAIKLLRQVAGTVVFDIYGPIEDQEYWRECQQAIATLPPNVSARYLGSVHPDNVPLVLSGYDLFLLPTRGENFGHVILEALLAGCLVLTSNRTPWRDLESRNAGWDLPLEVPSRFVAALQECVALSAAELSRRSEHARILARQYVLDETATEQNRRLFRNALAQSPLA
ncbi:MAG: glycosyltransferase [Gammaproteobacteria bacterium]|nr:MAG: glycosyltransferase [Gammaproteobacteria bacterium]